MVRYFAAQLATRNTFDKYRYESKELKGSKVGGKTLYKKEDLYLFVKL